MRECDLFVATGTSGTVWPAANFVRSAELVGARTVLVNLTSMAQRGPDDDEEIWVLLRSWFQPCLAYDACVLEGRVGLIGDVHAEDDLLETRSRASPPPESSASCAPVTSPTGRAASAPPHLRGLRASPASGRVLAGAGELVVGAPGMPAR